MSATKYAEKATASFDRSANSAVNTAMNAGMAWLDLVLSVQREMQRASLASFSSYSPTADTRISSRLPQADRGTVVVPVGEERLNVATRTVPGEVTRVRRRVVTQPVEQEVTLREEKVVVERRPASNTAPRNDVLTETVIEMSDSTQVPQVWKSLHVAEEVILRKNVVERTEKVRELVRRDVVDVEHAREAVPSRGELVVETQHVEHLPALRPEHAEKAQAYDAAERGEEKRGQDEAANSKKPAPAAQLPGSQPANAARKVPPQS